MLNELNQVIDYIEDHLTDDNLSLEIIAEHAGVSDYHFRKVFFYLSGLTLSEYIKYRKLSEAYQDLLNGEKVTDIAFKYGYQSIEGFTRAFKKWSGILPSEVIKNNVNKSFPKLSFIITVKGGNTMEFRIEDKPAFNFVGVSKRVPMQFEGINNEIVQLAKSITAEQKEAMHALQNMPPQEIVNVSYDADTRFQKEEGGLTHLIGVLTTENHVGNGLEKIPMEACSWAVFPNEGVFPATLQQTMAKAYSEWLPVSNYELVDAPVFSFTKMDQQVAGYAYCEVWIPVRKK
ncbi:AraC family transcriptional regulator [Parapedobacter lycopersici]|uniref:AraC family transcriptional regulator n=1 Tax=Parapedobacter lycopersici TaxID=1864939 RepID=UPI00214D9D6F|nr:AraC family transcriptional regulator [Parapedobacter lycopersici]